MRNIKASFPSPPKSPIEHIQKFAGQMSLQSTPPQAIMQMPHMHQAPSPTPLAALQAAAHTPHMTDEHHHHHHVPFDHGQPAYDDATSPEAYPHHRESTTRAYRRESEPMRNHQNKYVCSDPRCSDLSFDRKCEWNKHMDKHDRPYKCAEPGCEKLKGFTYSGGLIRHEREVHRKHGGPKRPLMCPHSDCKRSTGNGFSRKENLKEHLRRVHRVLEPGEVDSGLDGIDEAAEAAAQQQAASPADTDPNIHPSLKRRRADSMDAHEQSIYEAAVAANGYDVHDEVKRLKSENAQQAAAMARQEEEMRAQAVQVQRLQQQLNELMGIRQEGR